MTTDYDDDFDYPPLELLPHEIVCGECWIAYHDGLPSCPNCELLS